MGNIARILHALGTRSPRDLTRRACARGLRALENRRRRAADLAGETYLPPSDHGNLQSYWPALEPAERDSNLEWLRQTCDHFLLHRFDLLGSGWVRVRHGMACRGLDGNRFAAQPSIVVDVEGRWLDERINAANRASSRRVWGLVDAGYVPVDWQLDFKSGYRFSESTWYRDIRFGHVPGADVKVPWELARMQHLPRLAWAYALAGRGAKGFRPPEAYARECRNQILDFIATNPPWFGVNWSSSMDVAIRAANWLVACDWLRAAGATWDREFEAELVASIAAHGRYVRENLDWDPRWRGNHYLAGIVGLLFIAAYLPPDPVTNDWLSFAVEQLIREVAGQFSPDGSNFEASTSYHRLSAEMVAYGTALVLALSARGRGAFSFPAWYFERLDRMADFGLHVTKPGDQIHQVGDNDNGHFLNLRPTYAQLTVAEARHQFANLARYDELPDDATYWAEDHLDHRSLVAALAGLSGQPGVADSIAAERIETRLIRKWVGSSRATSARGNRRPPACAVRVGGEGEWDKLRSRLESDGQMRRSTWTVELESADITSDLELCAYSDFGLYIWRSARFYLAVRCGPMQHAGHGAHAHNDQLALELAWDGHEQLTDPGTAIYTPDAAARNRYRSVRAHCAPRTIDGREPGRLDLALFALGEGGNGRCLYFGPQGFAGVHSGFGRPIYRLVRLAASSITVEDFADRRMTLDESWFECLDADGARLPFSAGYGITATAPRGVSSHEAPKFANLRIHTGESLLSNRHEQSTKRSVSLPSNLMSDEVCIDRKSHR